MAKHPVSAVLSRAQELYQALHGFDRDGGPGQPDPLISRSFAQIIAGGIVREMATHIMDRVLAERVKQSGRALVERGAGALAAGYDRAEAPWLDLPFPFPWPPKKFDSHDSVFDTLAPGALDHVLSGLAHSLGGVASGTVRHPAQAA